VKLIDLIKVIRDFDGIKRKYPIVDVIENLKDTLNLGVVEIIGSFGEDSSIFKVPHIDNYYFLIAMDGIWYKLIDADPKLAGYFSVLVNVNDIYCKGGIPLVMVNNLGISSLKNGKKIVEGITNGCKKYKVPMIGGHLHPNEDRNSLSVAILGMVKKNEVIRSSTAEVGDNVIMAIDLDGKFNEKFIYAWDTTTHKTSEQVIRICESMREIAKNHLLTAAKDISNPGNLGTLGMLLESSRVGAIIDLEKIPIPMNIPIERWVKGYPGFGIIGTTKEKNIKKVIKTFNDRNIDAINCGKIIKENKLIISFKDEKLVLFDFNIDRITGLK